MIAKIFWIVSKKFFFSFFLNLSFSLSIILFTYLDSSSSRYLLKNLLICPGKVFISSKILPFYVKLIDQDRISFSIPKPRISKVIALDLPLVKRLQFLIFQWLKQTSINAIKPFLAFTKILETIILHIFSYVKPSETGLQ